MPVKSKSFTGCWTCRSRKIKCDLGTPSCRQCQKANIKCQGYSIKLRWSGEADPGNDRRAVEFVKFPPNMMYHTYEELDLDLNNLNLATPDGESTTVVGPFGVFSHTPQSEQQQQQQASRRRRKRFNGSNPSTPDNVNPTATTPVGAGAAGVRTNSVPNITSGTNSAVPSAPASTSASIAASSNNTPDGADTGVLPFNTDPSFLVGGSHDDVLRQFDTFEQDLVEMFPEAYMEFEPTGAAAPKSLLFGPEGPPSLDHPALLGDGFSLGNSASFLARSRYLLHFYKQQVVPVMTYVIHPKNPWSSIYLPRAYEAIGDIVATGTTSDSRYTLLHALMATAAFYIRNQMPPQSPQCQYYYELGCGLQNEAKAGLSRSVHGSTNKYKDFLVALLSMVSVDLVKGESGLGVVPLNAAQRLINSRCQKRPKLSRKARILHRICVMLTLLQRSTYFSNDELKLSDEWMDRTFEDTVEPQHNSIQIEQLEKLESRQHTLSYMDNSSQLEQYFQEYANQCQGSTANACDAPSDKIPNDYEAVSPQLIHGVPDSLVFIFKQVIEVSRKALICRTTGQEFDHGLTMACTQLEAHLETWKTQFEQTRPTDLLVVSVNEAVMHHSLAFHAALVVYHYRLAKDVNRMLLQPYLEKAIEHLEAITALNSDGRLIALPFFFTGFICACEIHPDNVELTRRYDNWFETMRRACLSTYSTALQVIAECRRRRAAGLGGDNWWEIVEEWGVALILI